MILATGPIGEGLFRQGVPVWCWEPIEDSEEVILLDVPKAAILRDTSELDGGYYIDSSHPDIGILEE